MGFAAPAGPTKTSDPATPSRPASNHPLRDIRTSPSTVSTVDRPELSRPSGTEALGRLGRPVVSARTLRNQVRDRQAIKRVPCRHGCARAGPRAWPLRCRALSRRAQPRPRRRPRDCHRDPFVASARCAPGDVADHDRLVAAVRPPARHRERRVAGCARGSVADFDKRSAGRRRCSRKGDEERPCDRGRGGEAEAHVQLDHHGAADVDLQAGRRPPEPCDTRDVRTDRRHGAELFRGSFTISR